MSLFQINPPSDEEVEGDDVLNSMKMNMMMNFGFNNFKDGFSFTRPTKEWEPARY